MPTSSADRKSRIEAALAAAFSPVHLSVVDDSERHRGHGGWREGGETHFTVELVSAAFTGVSRLERQRQVNAALAAEFDGGLHALSLSVRAPGE